VNALLAVLRARVRDRVHQEQITRLQRAITLLWRRPHPPTAIDLRSFRRLAEGEGSRRAYLRSARWWELEAARGHTTTLYSADGCARSRRYARNMRWAAELARIYGPGTWLELITRAGVPNPEPGRG
jgi:hypothetical protein